MKNYINSLMILLFLTACSQEHTKPLNYPILNNNGVNSINEKTPYESRFILPKILGYSIDELTTFTNGISSNIMRVHYHNKEVMLIIPTKKDKYIKRYVKEIIITDNYIKNSFNLKIGDIFDKTAFSTCTKSKEKIICKKDDFKNIKIVFTKEKDYILKEFIWSKSD